MPAGSKAMGRTGSAKVRKLRRSIVIASVTARFGTSIKSTAPVPVLDGNPRPFATEALKCRSAASAEDVMPKTNLKVIPGRGKSNVEDDIDALFRLPLSEFISARKTLAARLKKEGRPTEAQRVDALGKPSVSAWTVNQLYWQQREAFDQLIATGQRLRAAQTKGRSGKASDLRATFDERREVLAQLSDLATAVLRDGGHNPSLDTLRRTATSLEAMSAYAVLPDGVSAGRLTKDIDPPGFDSLAGFGASATVTPRSEPPRTNQPGKSSAEAKKPKQATADVDAGRLKKERQAKLAAAKLWLQQAKRSLAAAHSRTKNLEAAQKKAAAETKEAEKRRREAERHLKDANAAAEAALRRSAKITVELEQAREIVREAARAAAEASAELESLFRKT